MTGKRRGRGRAEKKEKQKKDSKMRQMGQIAMLHNLGTIPTSHAVDVVKPSVCLSCANLPAHSWPCSSCSRYRVRDQQHCTLKTEKATWESRFGIFHDHARTGNQAHAASLFSFLFLRFPLLHHHHHHRLSLIAPARADLPMSPGSSTESEAGRGRAHSLVGDAFWACAFAASWLFLSWLASLCKYACMHHNPHTLQHSTQ